MTLANLQVTGKWWRHTDYVIQDGYIVPVSGGVVEHYDVFQEYGERLKDARREPTAPYESFANLAGAADKDILEWTMEYGPVGILLHDLAAVDFEDGQCWVRTNDRWRLYTGNAPLPRRGTVRLTASPLRPKAEDHLGSFFPNLPETCAWPEPMSQEFFRQYSEPIAKIRTIAEYFRHLLSLFDEVEPITENASDEERRALRREAKESRLEGLRWLQVNVDLSPSVEGLLAKRSKGSFNPVLVSPSLIASMAFMLWQDLLGGATAGRCALDGCGRVFVTRREKQEYCSPKCRNADAARRVRRKKAKAKQLYSQGMSVRDIAAAVDSDPDTVRGWVISS